jgi:hypothetical protein
MTATDPRDIYAGDFDVVPVGPRTGAPGSRFAVIHRASGMVAPADPACPWLTWAEGKTPLACYGSRVKAREWFVRLNRAGGTP